MAAKRRSRAFWKEKVLAWRASGQAREVFAAKHGIKPKALSWWAWRLDHDGELGETDEVVELKRSFVEVQALAVDDRIEIEVGDARVRVGDDFDPKTLARVLEVLGAR